MKTKKIPLTQGRFAIVDAEDYERLNQFKWTAFVAPGNPDYAVRRIRIATNKRRTLWMHRVILNAPEAVTVDHINGNGLDNRKANLRFSNPSQNRANCKLSRLPSSGYRGVRKQCQRWTARMNAHGAYIHLGTFDTPEMAFEAYRQAHIKHFGEYSVYASRA